jgi:hypothetical protein
VKYIIDTEFIDTPSCSALISLAVVREDGDSRYFEFDYPEAEITPWLAENVVPHLRANGVKNTFTIAAATIEAWIGRDMPEFWAYYGAYDWYWFARLFGGFMQLPKHWPMLHREFAYIQQGVPAVAGAEHNALNDCRSILAAMKLKGLVGSGGDDANG